VVRFPLQLLHDQAAVATQWMSRPLGKPEGEGKSVVQWQAPFWQVGKDRVWGATAMVLAELAEMLHPITAFHSSNRV
jgi:hypothetical protein